MTLQEIFNLETDLFPCLVDMRFLGVRVDVLKRANRIKKRIDRTREAVIATPSEKRNRSRHSDMGCTIDCNRFSIKLNLCLTIKPRKHSEPSFTKNFLSNHRASDCYR